MTYQKNNSIPEDMKRYSKQVRYPGLGIEGQMWLSKSCAIVVGCGALGSVSANLLARSGVGRLVLIDRDFVELDNLQRQVIFTEKDVGMPKAVVAKEFLQRANSEIEIISHVADLDFRNIENLILVKGIEKSVVVDGTDNFETRFLINDACVKNLIPWSYAGCLGAEGQTMTVLPNQTACLHCLMLDGPPPPGTTETCDSGGILSTIINVVASVQVNETIKILSGREEQVNRKLQVFDLWGNRNHAVELGTLREKVDCPCCKQNRFDWLDGKHGSQPTVLCGRNAVQVSFPERQPVDLAALAKRLKPIGNVVTNPFLVRFEIDEYVVTVFADGRAIVNGTEDITTAKKLYAQYVGA